MNIQIDAQANRRWVGICNAGLFGHRDADSISRSPQWRSPMKLLCILRAGRLLGVGLAVAGMTDPAKVLGFLDFAGERQPTLGIVIAVALLVTGPVFATIRQRKKPLLAASYHIPSTTRVDWPPMVVGMWLANQINSRLAIGSSRSAGN